MNKRYVIFGLVVFLTLGAFGFVLATPSGGSITDYGNETAPVTDPTNLSAFAGNITEIGLTGYSTTQSWQGYFGNVSGTIQLADANSAVMYNWSQASAIGEVYSSTNQSISWSSIECFNFTEDTGEINSTLLEERYGINYTDVDGVDETFTLNNHADFLTGGVQFTAGECNNTKVYGAGGVGAFDEVILYEPGADSVVFASILDDDTTGFDSATHDFEMLVLENGHAGNTATTLYYFYMELG